MSIHDQKALEQSQGQGSFPEDVTFDSWCLKDEQEWPRGRTEERPVQAKERSQALEEL